MPDENQTRRKQISDDSRREGIASLRKMFKEQERFKNIQIDDVYYERFLYGATFDVKAAFNKISMFYDALLDHPRWYQIVAPLDYKPLIEKDFRLMLSEFDKEGRPIYVVKLGNVDVRTMDIFDVVAVDDIWLESLFSSNADVVEKGLCVIVDIANYPWRMIKWFTPEYIKESLKKLQALPFRDYRFHVVNSSGLIHATLKILWPFLPEHIKQMVKFHFNNRESLLQHIDQQALPLEYGGTNNVNFSEIYKKLYDRNEEIHNSLKSYRSVCNKNN